MSMWETHKTLTDLVVLASGERQLVVLRNLLQGLGREDSLGFGSVGDVPLCIMWARTG